MPGRWLPGPCSASYAACEQMRAVLHVIPLEPLRGRRPRDAEDLPKGLKPKSKEDLDLSICSFFSSSEKSRFNLKDEYGKPLFDHAVERLSKLAPDEMYGFEPALVIGGAMRLEI